MGKGGPQQPRSRLRLILAQSNVQSTPRDGCQFFSIIKPIQMMTSNQFLFVNKRREQWERPTTHREKIEPCSFAPTLAWDRKFVALVIIFQLSLHSPPRMMDNLN